MNGASQKPATDATDAYRQTVIVFDWDDTLLPGSWLEQQGLQTGGFIKSDFVLTPEQQKELSRIAKTAVELIQLAISLGSVMIITNATQGWVQESCHKFLPSLAPLVETLPVISARSCLEEYPNASSTKWKLLTFENLLQQASDTHLISIGDGPLEREALFALAPKLQNCCAKSVKLFERADTRALSKQQTLIACNLSAILQHARNLDLLVEGSAELVEPASKKARTEYGERIWRKRFFLTLYDTCESAPKTVGNEFRPVFGWQRYSGRHHQM